MARIQFLQVIFRDGIRRYSPHNLFASMFFSYENMMVINPEIHDRTGAGQVPLTLGRTASGRLSHGGILREMRLT